MNTRLTRRTAIGLAAILVAGICLMDVGAQRRRRRHRSSAPRITNPAIAQPSPTDSSGSAESSNGADTQANNPDQKADDPNEMRRTIRTLSSQVDKLNEKLSQMEE